MDTAVTKFPPVGTHPRRTQVWIAWACWLLWPALAIAAIVTAAEVANAVRSSPTASTFLRNHADEIGALAIRVESGGNTNAYNGSCCYGVLQLNTANILASGYSVAQYRAASLQDQVNAWSRIQSQALRDPAIQRLQRMSTFDGQPVDAAMLISCAQLGQGNCRRMIESGRCNGFADSNGTTICDMAATMRAAIGGAGPVGGGTGSGSGGTGGTGGGGGYTPGGVGTSATTGQAFELGSGVSMDHVSQSIKLVAAAIVLIWLSWSASGTWGLFMKGSLALPGMAQTIGRATVVAIMVIVLLT